MKYAFQLALLCCCIVCIISIASTYFYFYHIYNTTNGEWNLINLKTEENPKYIIGRKGINNESECLSIAVGCYSTENVDPLDLNGTAQQNKAKILKDATAQMNNIVKNYPNVTNTGTAENKDENVKTFKVLSCREFMDNFGSEAGYADNDSWCSLVKSKAKKQFGPEFLKFKM